MSYVFVIGLNKTGTTSLIDATRILGLSSSHSAKRTNKYLKLDKSRSQPPMTNIIQKFPHVKVFADGDIFQHYRELDKYYPGSKFIFTYRDKSSWLRSRIAHSEERYSKEKLEKFMVSIKNGVYNNLWITHNSGVMKYFEDKPDRFLILDICNGEGWEKLCRFLDKPIPNVPFPHGNKSSTDTTGVDVVYPLGSGSKANDDELRYSLRSLEKNFIDIRNVYIVGKRPKWITNIKHISVHDNFRTNKDANLITKVLEACKCEDLSDNFLRLSDDQIILKFIRSSEMLPYHSENLELKNENDWKKGKWNTRRKNTMKALVASGKPAFNYELHLPMMVNKQQFIDCMTKYNFAKGSGYCINTLYFNYVDLPNKIHMKEGVKITFETQPSSVDYVQKKIIGRTFLGYNNKGFNGYFRAVMDKMFPVKSKYEL